MLISFFEHTVTFIEPRYETENRFFANAKTKAQINCAADQRLCFRYTDSTITLLPKYKISSP